LIEVKVGFIPFGEEFKVW